MQATQTVTTAFPVPQFQKTTHVTGCALIAALSIWLLAKFTIQFARSIRYSRGTDRSK